MVNFKELWESPFMSLVTLNLLDYSVFAFCGMFDKSQLLSLLTSVAFRGFYDRPTQYMAPKIYWLFKIFTSHHLSFQTTIFSHPDCGEKTYCLENQE